MCDCGVESIEDVRFEMRELLEEELFCESGAELVSALTRCGVSVLEREALEGLICDVERGLRRVKEALDSCPRVDDEGRWVCDSWY